MHRLELLSGIDEDVLRKALLAARASPKKGPKQPPSIEAIKSIPVAAVDAGADDVIIVDSVADGNGDVAEDGSQRLASLKPGMRERVDSFKDHKNEAIFKEWLENSTEEEYELFQKWKERCGP